MKAFGRVRRKYIIGPELLERLQLAYAANRWELSAAIRRLGKETGWPRWMFTAEARRRGWGRLHVCKRWTIAEEDYLREHLGGMAVSAIARRLHRSVESAQDKARALRLSMRVRDGYTLEDLGEVFGAPAYRVRSWARRGLLGKWPPTNGRVDDHTVVRFIMRHGNEIDLRRVEQVWFKAMVFGRR